QFKLQIYLLKVHTYEMTMYLIDNLWDKNMLNVPQAYGLIKLHKQPHKLRIITPVVNWINVKAAQDVAKFLQPFVDQLPHILPNSLALLNDPVMTELSQSPIVCSFDVSDMYNSIDQTECLIAIERLAFNQGWMDAVGSDTPNYRKWKQILTLASWVFETSLLGFAGNTFLQKRGLPMGSPLSPVLANLYLAHLELISIERLRIPVTFRFFRYLDDMLFIDTHGKLFRYYKGKHPSLHAIELFLDYITAEAGNSSLNFEFTGGANKVNEYVEFLDLRIGIVDVSSDPDNVKFAFSTAVYDKPTNLHIYTDPSTFYPFHYVYNWIQGENIRLIRNSSSNNNYELTLNRFKQFLIRRKYLEYDINRFIRLNPYEHRSRLLLSEKPHIDEATLELRESINKRRYIMVQNTGARPILVKAIRYIANFDQTEPFTPVVRKGKSIISVLNKARKHVKPQ
ncbi:7279_t:CDS:1, partial [Funneliformis geosporum]